jgi:uncharacterized protein (TIGR03545 family)
MRKWIRWQGLVAFIIFVVSLSLLWFVFADLAAKKIIEVTGTRIVGAKVELDEADIQLFPLGITLSGLQVTNPHAPMTNAVEIARIAGLVDPVELLRRKAIIEEMSMEGVRFNTARKNSGAIRGPSKREKSEKISLKRILGTDLPSFVLPKAEEILAKEELQSVELAKALPSEIKEEQKKWTKEIAELPGEERIKEYEDRIENLKEMRKTGPGGIVGAAVELTKLKQDIESDLNKLRKAEQDFNSSMNLFKERLAQVQRAPADDAKRLASKYSLDSHGLANLTRLLFGPRIAIWVERGLSWHERLEPLYERVKKEYGSDAEVVKPLRGKGLEVRFREHKPLPDFLIRKVKSSVSTQGGDMEGRIENITPDQDILGKPLTFLFSGTKLSVLQSFRVDGIFDHVSRLTASDRINLKLRGYQAQQLTLAESDAFSVKMAKGLADLDLGSIVSNGAIDIDFAAALKSTKLEVNTPAESGPVGRAISSTLTGVSSFSLNAKVSGNLDDYTMQLSSDLDRVLKDSVSAQLKDQIAKLEQELRADISERVSGPIEQAKSSLGDFAPLGDELEKRLQDIISLQKEAIFKKPSGGLPIP